MPRDYLKDEYISASLQRGSFPRMEEVSSAATGSTVVDLSGDSHLQVRRGWWVGGNSGHGWLTSDHSAHSQVFSFIFLHFSGEQDPADTE